ncbi:MAG: bifunctional metallophosphatase/5'-nucleotidase [Acidobacteriota bacterium]
MASAGCSALGGGGGSDGQGDGKADGTGSGTTVSVKLLALNDFHGQIDSGKKLNNRPAGGAGVLAAYLRAAEAGMEERTIFTSSGDLVGASPPASGLLEDEPAMMFMNLFANDDGSNVVGTLGNHEFDRGSAEMLRKLFGGNSAKGPYLVDPYPGAAFPYVNANAVDSMTGQPLLQPYVIERVGGVQIAFIGAITKNTPSVVMPSALEGVTFLDEADAINQYIPEIQAQGVHAIVVLIHEGGDEAAFDGATTDGSVSGRIVDVVSRLDADVDVVLSGHTHRFTNAMLPNAGGKKVLVTQAYSYSVAFANVDLAIDRKTDDIVGKSAKIVLAYADEGPGLTPDPAAQLLETQADQKVAPIVGAVIGHATADLSRSANEAGEENLGDLVADAQRAATGAQIAVTNPFGIRADIPAGDVTWGELYAAQPFANNLVTVNLTGDQLYQLLEQQWVNQPTPEILQVSGMSFTWDGSKPLGQRIVEVRRDGQPVDRAATYTVACNAFLASGGDNFTVFRSATGATTSGIDLDALVAYVRMVGSLDVALDGRIQRVH